MVSRSLPTVQIETSGVYQPWLQLYITAMTPVMHHRAPWAHSWLTRLQCKESQLDILAWSYIFLKTSEQPSTWERTCIYTCVIHNSLRVLFVALWKISDGYVDNSPPLKENKQKQKQKTKNLIPSTKLQCLKWNRLLNLVLSGCFLTRSDNMNSLHDMICFTLSTERNNTYQIYYHTFIPKSKHWASSVLLASFTSLKTTSLMEDETGWWFLVFSLYKEIENKAKQQ